MHGNGRRQRFSTFYTRVHIANNACTMRVPLCQPFFDGINKWIQISFYFSFFFGLVKWNSISMSIFRFSSTCDIEKRIWILFYVFRFRRTLKRGFEFRFLFFVFSSLWKTDFNFVFRICIAHCLLSSTHSHWKTDWSFLHEFEKWINTPVIWNSTPPPPPKGMTGVMRGLSLHNHSIFIPR